MTLQVASLIRRSSRKQHGTENNRSWLSTCSQVIRPWRLKVQHGKPCHTFKKLDVYIGSILLALRYFVSSYDIPSYIYTNMHVTSNSSMSHFVTSHCSYIKYILNCCSFLFDLISLINFWDTTNPCYTALTKYQSDFCFL